MRNGSDSETNQRKINMSKLTRENVTYDELMNIAHSVYEIVQYSNSDVDKNQHFSLLLDYEFSKFKEDMGDANEVTLFDLLSARFIK